MSFIFFSSRRRHTRLQGDWSSDVCSSDLTIPGLHARGPPRSRRTRPAAAHWRRSRGACARRPRPARGCAPSLPGRSAGAPRGPAWLHASQKRKKRVGVRSSVPLVGVVPLSVNAGIRPCLSRPCSSAASHDGTGTCVDAEWRNDGSRDAPFCARVPTHPALNCGIGAAVRLSARGLLTVPVLLWRSRDTRRTRTMESQLPERVATPALPGAPRPWAADELAATSEGGLDWRRVAQVVARFKWLVLGITLAGGGAGVAAPQGLKAVVVAQGAGVIRPPEPPRQDRGGPIRSGQVLDPQSWIDLLRSYA